MLGVDLGEPLSEKLGLLLELGVEIAGDRAFRKSVYAVGGVIGVLASSSCLITSRSPAAGLLGSCEGSCEGKVAEHGVFNGGSSGLGERGLWMVGTSAAIVVIVVVVGGVGDGSGETEDMMACRDLRSYNDDDVK